MSTMKLATINPDLTVTFEHDVAIPTPDDFEVVIKAETAAINPTDWKASLRKTAPDHQASGKDFAGIVHSVGSKVFQFKPGDRVGAFNITSGYAEYSIGPSSTTFKLPDHVSFEEAASLGLPYYTAALGLFKDMHAPAPWSPARPSDYNALLVYGASSAVGAYVVKLAALANIHPIIAIAGAAAKHTIADIIRPELGDVIIDYREHKASDTLITAIKTAASHSGTVKYAYDVIGTEHTINDIIAHVLDPEVSSLAYAVPISFTPQVPENTSVSLTWAPGLFKPLPQYANSQSKADTGANGKNNEGSRAHTSVVSRYLEFALGEDLIKSHPFKVLPDGLSSLQEGLQDLKQGRNKSLKYVMQIGKTKW